MKVRYFLVGAAAAALCGPAMAGANILPGSGASVSGSSIHSGFDAGVAAGNLINGTSNAAYFNGDPRWVFDDGPGAETLVVDLGTATPIDFAGIVYNVQDRIPSTFEVLTSNDNISFTPVAGPGSVSDGTAGLMSAGYTFATTSARYVKFNFGTDSVGGFGFGGGAGQGAGIYQLSLAVPEPATWATMMLGLFGTGALLRSRRRQAAALA